MTNSKIGGLEKHSTNDGNGGKNTGSVFSMNTKKILNVSHLNFMAKCSFRKNIDNETKKLLRKHAT
jgi:hypothetical protein